MINLFNLKYIYTYAFKFTNNNNDRCYFSFVILLFVLTVYLSRYAPRTPTTPQRHLLFHPQSLSPAVTCDRSICPSPTPMFQHLCHAVAYWEKFLLDRSPTPGTDQENIASSTPNEEPDGSDVQPSGSSCFASASYPPISPARRMTVPSIRVLEYDTHQVVTLDPVYPSHTDLDDISQPENGVVADAEISASDSESEASAKEDQSEPITETPYVANENEILGTVSSNSAQFLIRIHIYNKIFTIHRTFFIKVFLNYFDLS